MNSGSKYFNYKKQMSVVLMAICDANYKFTYVNVGECGSNNDAGVWERSEIGQGLEDGMFFFIKIP